MALCLSYPSRPSRNRAGMLGLAVIPSVIMSRYWLSLSTALSAIRTALPPASSTCRAFCTKEQPLEKKKKKQGKKHKNPLLKICQKKKQKEKPTHFSVATTCPHILIQCLCLLFLLPQHTEWPQCMTMNVLYKYICLAKPIEAAWFAYILQ